MATHYEGTAEERLALDAIIKLTRAANSVQARLNARGTIGDLTMTQFAVLEALYHLGPLCQGTLSQKLLTSTGNMTLVLDNLEKRGLVCRVRSTTDRRMVNIELTEAGSQLIKAVLPVHVQAIVEEMRVLSPEELLELGRLSRKLGRGERV